jgi:hypothetical protein
MGGSKPKVWPSGSEELLLDNFWLCAYYGLVASFFFCHKVFLARFQAGVEK